MVAAVLLVVPFVVQGVEPLVRESVQLLVLRLAVVVVQELVLMDVLQDVMLVPLLVPHLVQVVTLLALILVWLLVIQRATQIVRVVVMEQQQA